MKFFSMQYKFSVCFIPINVLQLSSSSTFVKRHEQCGGLVLCLQRTKKPPLFYNTIRRKFSYMYLYWRKINLQRRIKYKIIWKNTRQVVVLYFFFVYLIQKMKKHFNFVWNAIPVFLHARNTASSNKQMYNN